MNNKQHKIRVHFARVETRYGTDTTVIFDDPVKPIYTEEKVTKELKKKLNYKAARGNSEYPGYCDDVGAYFDYNGYLDCEIPKSIVDRIMKA